MNQDQVSERALREQEQVLNGTVCVREILAYLQLDRFLSLKEAAQFLPLSEKTIRKHLRTIPHFRCGKKIIFRRSELARWMETFRVRDQDLDAALRMAEELLG